MREPGPSPDLDCMSGGTVDWIVVPQTGSTLLVSFARTPAVELVVPGAYATAPLQALDAAVRTTAERGTGCTDVVPAG